MNRRLTSAVLGGAMAATLAFAGPASAQLDGVEFFDVDGNGSKAVVATVNDALVELELDDVDVAVVEIEDSLNNLQALNNVLNNSPILSNNNIDVDIQDVDIEVLEDILNDLDIDLDLDNLDVLGFGLLDNGDLLLIVAD